MCLVGAGRILKRFRVSDEVLEEVCDSGESCSIAMMWYSVTVGLLAERLAWVVIL